MASAEQCPDDAMRQVLAALRSDKDGGIAAIRSLAEVYPDDARLPFLGGSVLAGMQRYDEALEAMQRATEIAPGFVLARFQYGFLLLTCARADEAQAVWTPLLGLPQDNCFHLFAQGLGHLIRDEFASTIACLEAGISQNSDNPLLNNDMQLIIDEVRVKLANQPANAPDVQSERSEAALLFERYAVRDPGAYKH